MKQPASARSKRFKLALLPLLALSACITPAPVGPRPVFAPVAGDAARTDIGPISPPQSLTPATPSPSDSASPSPADTASPHPTPSDANLPAPSSSSGPCDTGSREISFVVYANSEDRDLHYTGTELDTRTPLKDNVLGLGSISQNYSDYRFSVPRASLKNGFEIRHAGYWPLISTGGGESLCASMYVGLSPLSAEEQTGQALSMESQDLYAVGSLPPFMQRDEASNFSYAVLRDRSAANPLLNWLAQNGQGATRTAVDKALDAGRMVVLFSNNSSQMGDISSVIHSAIETPTSLILASHDSGMTQYPKPGNGSYGDIFSKRLEIKLLPRSDKRVIFEAHRSGVNSAKVRLEAK